MPIPNIETAVAMLATRKLTLRTSPPKDGYGHYLWRMVRFHGGLDVTMPTTCFFHLQNEVEREGGKANVSSVFDEEGKRILNELDGMVDKLCVVFGLDPNRGALAWRNVI